MSRSITDASLQELVQTLTPNAVSRYLASHDWELESRQDDIREIWRLPGHDGDLLARIMLPLDSEYLDYPRRFFDALKTITLVNDWDANKLYEEVTVASADLLYIRLDQAMSDGTIPFKQAESTIGAIYRMMRAAATTAADPSHTHRGRRSTPVNEFLDKDVRLGHTKRGSFVFTVVTRLDGGEPPPQSSSDPDTPFSRRVMTTLARGLETTRQLARGQSREALDSPAEWGLSANLVESLEEMAGFSRLRALDMSFEWAAIRGVPAMSARLIKLEQELLEQLPLVRERLVRREEPPRRETLVGPVKSLTREEGVGIDDEAGTVVITAYVNGRIRNVHLILSGEDHDWAIKAYRHKLPLTVSGDLTFERRSWRLVGDTEVDTSFLRHRLGGNPEGDS
ncbi:YbjN domain-containing protein [Acrocarpospora catenulata]|uniref:YbjN domain-containing protein n=1 Tax=Acrocarpospora catenulata TaxID=2836182 RepID=UPI001BDA9709|nr:YbjN domain-containing protein [Acrocarpospora catenulata]